MNFVLQKKYLIQLILACFCFIHTSFILASSLEDDFTGDMPIILSATRLAQPQNEAPVATTIIDRKMIEAMGVTEIPEIFRMVPGFQVAFSDGTIPVVTYHGLSDEYARRMQILIDGRSVYTPMFGGPEWADLPLAIEDIERIEVIRGPNAVTYGANSFQAVINIITRSAAEEYGHTAKFIKGSKDTNHTFYRYGFQHENINTRISFRHQDDHGTKLDFGDPAKKFIGDSKMVNMFTLRSDIQIDNKNSFEVHLGGTDSWMEKGTGDHSYRNFHKKHSQRHYQLLRWRNISSTNSETTIQFFHNFNKTDDTWLSKDLTPIGLAGKYLLRSEDTIDQRIDLEGQHIVNFNKNNRLVFGASIRKDSVESYPFFTTNKKFNNYIYRVFGNSENKFGNLLINTGMMIENNSITDTDISPRIALNYHVNKKHTLRTSISRAYRNPVVFEEFGDHRYVTTDGSTTNFNIWASGGLRPESILSKEIGYIFQDTENGLFLDAKLFRDSIKNIITFADDRVPPAEDNYPIDLLAEDIKNLNWAKVEGIETQVKYTPDKKNYLIANYAYINAQSDNVSLDDENYLSRSVPKHSFSLFLSHNFGNNFSSSLSYFKVNGMSYLGSGGPVKNYNRVDMRLAYDKRRGNSNIKTELFVH
ncbi:MAG: TonB-dependent receptor, partial [Gammaproteobacteria bacterium]|nr:TonB-dependent receptor [Gammaproteobacteria bacterium]